MLGSSSVIKSRGFTNPRLIRRRVEFVSDDGIEAVRIKWTVDVRDVAVRGRASLSRTRMSSSLCSLA